MPRLFNDVYNKKMLKRIIAFGRAKRKRERRIKLLATHPERIRRRDMYGDAIYRKK